MTASRCRSTGKDAINTMYIQARCLDQDSTIDELKSAGWQVCNYVVTAYIPIILPIGMYYVSSEGQRCPEEVLHCLPWHIR